MPGIIELIRRSFAIYRSHGSFFAGYAAWLLLPYAGFILADLLPVEEMAQVVMAVLAVVMLFLWIWVTVILTRAARDILSGKPLNPPELVSSSVALFRSVVFANILYALVSLGGFLLLIIPGILFTVWYALTAHTVMLDGKRGIEALTESRELTRGKFWSVAWYFLGGPILISIAYYIPVSVVIFIIAALTGTSIEALIGDTPPMWSELLLTVTDVFMLPLTTIYLTSVYLEFKKGS